ncbi:MAG: lamin tail domain-containing protein [Candidatus Nanoarchaeia archaeon]
MYQNFKPQNKNCEELIDEIPQLIQKAKEGRDFLIVEVIDGDTLKTRENKTIRLLGINAPEKDMKFYDEAKEFVQNKTLNKKVYLVRDVESQDKYNRSLRYAFTEDSFINAELLSQGLATLFIVKPNTKYEKLFTCLEDKAKIEKRGIWSFWKNTYIELKINYDAPGNDSENINGEFITIKNKENYTLNLTGWTIKDAATHIYKFKKEVYLNPNEEITLYSGTGIDSKKELYWNSNIPIWNNDGDAAYLFDEKGNLITYSVFP